MYKRLCGVGALLPLIALASPLALLASGASKASTAAPQKSFAETVRVRVVNVDAVVTDRDGVRVPGLMKDDFRLLVDGQEVPIAYFSEIRGGDVVQGASGESGLANVPALVPGEPVGTSYLVFVDDYFSIPDDRNLVLESLRHELPLLGPQDRLAVVAFDGRRVQMLSSWEQSADRLDAVLREAEQRPAQGFQRWAERHDYDLDRRLPASLSFRRSAVSRFELAPDELFYADLLSDQVERTVMAAATTLRGFAAPPGRKVLLLLSGGWPFDVSAFTVDALTRPVVELGIPNGEELMRPLVETANLLGYTIYGVDVPGNQLNGFSSARSLAVDLETPHSLSFEREYEVQSSLQFLARQTGGEAVLNARRAEGLSTAVSDTRSYYWLGFEPQRIGDDKEHKIAVEMRDGSLKVRARRDFVDLSRDRELKMAVESALLFGNPPSPRPLLVNLEGTAPQPRDRMLVSLDVTVPTDAVSFLPESGQYVAHLELLAAAIDSQGRTSDVPAIPFTLSSADPPGAGARLSYEAKLTMRNLPQDLVVAVVDQASGAMLSTVMQVAPPREPGNT